MSQSHLNLVRVKVNRRYPSPLLERKGDIPITLNDLGSLVHEFRKDWGYYDGIELLMADGVKGKPVISHGDYQFIASRLAHIMSEAGEAFSELQHARVGARDLYSKPEGMVIELCDVVLLSLELLSGLGYNAEELVRRKMAYNFTQPTRSETEKVL